MKYYILSFLLLFSFGLKAQITYTPLSAAGYQIKYLKADSGFALPVVDTGLRRNVIRPGLMVINPLDSLPYYYSGVKWKPVYVDSSGVIALINNKVDSVTINGSTLFYWVAGLGYGTTINKIDSVTQSGDSVFTWINGVSTYSFQLTAGSGTVTQVIGGYGLVSDTITSNGILRVDTSVIAAKSWSTAQFAPISHTHSASDIISGTLPIARGGTGMSGIGAVGQLIRVAASGTALEYFSPDYYNSATSIDSSSYSLNKTNGDKTVFVFDGETESSIDSTTASNGLTKVVNDVQLGGKLNNNTTIDRNGHYLYLRDSTGAATGLYIISTGTGLQVQSTSTGPGINVFTTGSQAISLNTTYSGTNNIQPILTYYRNSSGTAANGIGGSLDFNIQNASGSGSIVNQIISKLTNASFGTSLQSQFQITGVSNATTNNLLSLNGDGSAQLNKYGAGTFTGTPAKQLSVDATGNIIETAQPIITSGTAAPTSTPAKVGDIYVDITNKKLYFAAGNSSSSDWIIAN